MPASARKSAPDSSRNREHDHVREIEIDLDVPATVVCAHCGDVDCPGCAASELSRSGVVTLIAWERPGGRTLGKLWETARATTRDAEAFFELLPDGPIAPALRFAVLCELLAAFASIMMLLALTCLVAPGWIRQVATDPQSRDLALRIFAISVPGLAALLVAAHAAHGFSLDIGAKKNGARRAGSRALRFGLYATGWDLVIGPIGAVVLAMKEGLGAALSVSTMAMGLPTRASRAFLRGCYRLTGKPADSALGTSYVAAVLATLVGAFAIVVAAVAIVLALG